MEKLLRKIALLFDERSMIGQVVICCAEMSIQQAAHNGGHDNEDWGGIPIVVAFGDDDQLPSPCLRAINCLMNQGKCKVSQNGAQQFLNWGRTMMELTKIMRQNEDKRELLELLGNVRVGFLSEQNIHFI